MSAPVSGPPNDDLPNVDPAQLRDIDTGRLAAPGDPGHPPRVLMLYGSLRTRSYSKLLTEEAARVLRALGAEVRIFDPAGLPLADGAPETHEKVDELRRRSGRKPRSGARRNATAR